MTQKTRWVVASLTLGGVLLGGVVGFFQPDLMVSLGFIGGLFLNALRLLILPLIVAACVAGVASLGQWKRISGALGAGLLYFLITTLAAVAVALLLVTLVGPGSGMPQTGVSVPPEVLQSVLTAGDDLVDRFIPSNQIGAVLSGNYFGLILFALFFGLGLAALGSRQRVVLEFFRGVRDTIVRLVRLLLYAAPVGLFFLVGRGVAQADLHQPGALGNLAQYLLVVFGALLIHGVIILPLILKYFGGRSPLEFFGNFLPAFGTALGTGSSTATVPVTWECVVDKSHVDSRAGALMIPLGSTINLDGSAIATVVATMFVAQVFGLDLSALQVLVIVGATLLASLGTAGLPGASLLMTVMVFNAAGFPEYVYAGLGVVVAADWLVERGRAAVNVWSDAVGAAFVEQRIRAAGVIRTPAAGRTRTETGRDGRTAGQRRPADDRDRRSIDTGRERGRRRTDDQSRGRGRDRTGYQKRDQRPAVGNGAGRGAKAEDTRPSPFAMPADSRSGFDPDAPHAGVEETTGGRGSIASGTEDQGRDTNGRGRPTSRQRPAPDRSRPPRRATSSPREPKRSRREPEITKTEADSPARHEPATELTPRTIERERERVSAHLAALRQNERLKEEAPEANGGADDSPQPSQPEEAIGAGLPQVDYYSGPTGDSVSDEERSSSGEGDDDEVSAHHPASAAENADDGESGEDENENGSVDYGRRRVRRGEKFKGGGGSEEAAAPEKREGDGDELSAEVQSFGRVKKKRTR